MKLYRKQNFLTKKMKINQTAKFLRIKENRTLNLNKRINPEMEFEDCESFKSIFFFLGAFPRKAAF